MSVLDSLERFIEWAERKRKAAERGDEDALWLAGFINLTAITVVVILIVLLLWWWF